MARVQMRDMVILLPGIMGSVLQKDGQDLWAISGQAAWTALWRLGSSIEKLNLEEDDPEVDALGDGIRATRLMPDAHMVPGLWKIDGYSAISTFLANYFELERGSVSDEMPANYFEFPYDWRRDNRVAARQLKEFVGQRLRLWRESSNVANAKVILLAHSMGGLVARYYLEVYEGWRDCKALITFGTPYRGSVNALNFLANGYKKLFIDLSELLRSFTSVYQLMPIYRVLDVDEEFRRVAETDDIPGVHKGRAEQALAFHREIEVAVNKHKNDASYQQFYKTIPMVGTHQLGLQSAKLSGGRLSASRSLPAWIDSLLDGSDGTVPRLSAIPIELSQEYRESFIAERHGSLQNNRQVLSDLGERLKQMQTSELSSIRGARASRTGEEQPAISLDLDDLYVADEPVKLRAKLVNMDPQGEEPPRARIEPVAGRAVSVEGEFREEEEGWAFTVRDLVPGLYRVKVWAGTALPQGPASVHDIFEVGGDLPGPVL
jgi:hypothetical protein